MGSDEPGPWQEEVDRFAASRPPTVRYKPSDPSFSVVYPGAEMGDVMLAAAAGLAAVGGLWFAIFNIMPLFRRRVAGSRESSI